MSFAGAVRLNSRRRMRSITNRGGANAIVTASGVGVVSYEASTDRRKGPSIVDWKLELVPIPVADVDRAKRFYSEQLNFTVDHDTSPSETMRIVQLTPPGSACAIVLGSMIQTKPGSVHGLHLVVTDINAARAELIDRGVDATPVRHFGPDGEADGHGGPFNAFVHFSDPDGNSWVIQEGPADTDS